MACPYFFPTERAHEEWWPHRRRLPLGDGWRGECAASGMVPSDDELRDWCNLGHAARCPHLPPDRAADSVRFGAALTDDRMRVTFVYERAHRPGETGVLEFDRATRICLAPHEDRCLQRMAECYLKTWLLRRQG
ncbi:MAG: hypothetical protein ACE14L_17690 [Terriglobales bacterium]